MGSRKERVERAQAALAELVSSLGELQAADLPQGPAAHDLRGRIYGLLPRAREVYDAWTSDKAANGRGAPALECYSCGSTRTTPIDASTRACRRCGVHYAIARRGVE